MVFSVVVCRSTGGFAVFFFFQAEDGIRDLTVTGVQTCALPIYDHGHIIQNQNFHPQYTIPLTPHSCSEMHGTAGTYQRLKIGRAACRGRGWISVGARSLKKKKD